MVEIEEIELYDVESDVSESTNVASEYPEIVGKIKLLANGMRSRLGDSLLDLEGSETREAGQLK